MTTLLRRAVLVGVLAVRAPSVVLAHGTPSRHDRSAVLWTWSWDPLVLGILCMSGLLYGMGVLRMRGTGLAGGWRPMAFLSGWLTIVIALLSPVHQLSSVLFAVHMTQHELLMLVAAPLMVMSRPMVVILWALPRRVRLRAARWMSTRAVRRSWRALTGGLTAWLLHGAVLWMWHIPVLFEAALTTEAVHALQHASFFAVAMLFWWALIYGRYGRMGYGIAVAYVFTTALHTGLLGALITFAGQVWYLTYEGRTVLWGLTALEDQQIGGLIMWVPGGVVFTLVGLALFAAWLGEVEARAVQRRCLSLQPPM